MKRADIITRLPVVFGLERMEAAASVGVSVNTFDAMIADGRMPRPRMIGTKKLWDVDELRAAFKCLPKDGEDNRAGNTWADVG